MKNNIIAINDNKFKSIFISVNFMRKLKREENAKGHAQHKGSLRAERHFEGDKLP